MQYGNFRDESERHGSLPIHAHAARCRIKASDRIRGRSKVCDLTRPPGSSESKYDDLRTAAVATAVAAWFRKKHGEVADETNDDAPASLRSEAPASSPGKLPADDAAMDETLSGTASPTRETTPAQSAAPEQEASHDDDDGCLEDMRLSARNDEGEADTSTPDAAVRRSERVKDAPERLRFTYTPAEVGSRHSYNRKDEDEQYLPPAYAREFDAALFAAAERKQALASIENTVVGGTVLAVDDATASRSVAQAPGSPARTRSAHSLSGGHAAEASRLEELTASRGREKSRKAGRKDKKLALQEQLWPPPVPVHFSGPVIDDILMRVFVFAERFCASYGVFSDPADVAGAYLRHMDGTTKEDYLLLVAMSTVQYFIEFIVVKSQAWDWCAVVMLCIAEQAFLSLASGDLLMEGISVESPTGDDAFRKEILELIDIERHVDALENSAGNRSHDISHFAVGARLLSIFRSLNIGAAKVVLASKLADVADERDNLAAERDDLMMERDDLLTERDDLVTERDDLVAELEVI